MMVNRIVGYIVRAIKALREAPSLTEFHCYWHSFFLQKLLLTFRSLFLDDIENVSECSNIFIINRALSFWNIQLNDFVTTEGFNVIIHLYSGIQLERLHLFRDVQCELLIMVPEQVSGWTSQKMDHGLLLHIMLIILNGKTTAQWCSGLLRGIPLSRLWT